MLANAVTLLLVTFSRGLMPVSKTTEWGAWSLMPQARSADGLEAETNVVLGAGLHSLP